MVDTAMPSAITRSSSAIASKSGRASSMRPSASRAPRDHPVELDEVLVGAQRLEAGPRPRRARRSVSSGRFDWLASCASIIDDIASIQTSPVRASDLGRALRVAFRRLGIALVLGELAQHDRAERRTVGRRPTRPSPRAAPGTRPGRASRAGSSRPHRATAASDAAPQASRFMRAAPRAPVVLPVARCVAVIRVRASMRAGGELGRRVRVARAVEHGRAEGEDLGVRAADRPAVGERREDGERRRRRAASRSPGAAPRRGCPARGRARGTP